MIALDTPALRVPRRTVRQTMTQVMLALVPGTLIYALLIDSRIVFQVAVTCLLVLLCEALCLMLRSRPLAPALSDGSAVLAGWLLALCLPPSLPLWQLCIGAALLITLGKHLFGGLGNNPFNPAMVAYAVLLISFPVSMTNWDIGEHALWGIYTSDTGDAASAVSDAAILSWDGMTGATVLDRLRESKLAFTASDETLSETASIGPDTVSAAADAGVLILRTPWVWVSAMWLAGGLYLLWARIISWHIPTSLLLSLAGLYGVSSVLPGGIGVPVLPALFSGAIMLGAFFIATDPVSAAASRQGQLIYGGGIGVFTFVIREYSVYPEGIAFAVLLMNLCVPLLDRLSTGQQGRIV